MSDTNYNDPPLPSPPPQSEKTITPPAPPQPTLTDAINTIADRAEPLIAIIKQIAEHVLRSQEAKSRFSFRMSLVAGGIVTLIVIVAGLLTYMGKVDGSTFGFLLGLVVGYVLTFIRDSIRPPDGK
jgi:hypothetical protein